MEKCLRCIEKKKAKPNETGKIIDGAAVCRECMLEDAGNNRGRVISYEYLNHPPKETREEAVKRVLGENKIPPAVEIPAEKAPPVKEAAKPKVKK